MESFADSFWMYETWRLSRKSGVDLAMTSALGAENDAISEVGRSTRCGGYTVTISTVSVWADFRADFLKFIISDVMFASQTHHIP